MSEIPEFAERLRGMYEQTYGKKFGCAISAYKRERDYSDALVISVEIDEHPVVGLRWFTMYEGISAIRVEYNPGGHTRWINSYAVRDWPPVAKMLWAACVVLNRWPKYV